MSVSPEEFEANNGKSVIIIDFTGAEYEGTLYYTPSVQFAVEIWKNNDCCDITYIAADDVDTLIPENMLMFGINNICEIVTDCRDFCMPEAINVSIYGNNYKFSEDKYILEWDKLEELYRFNYHTQYGLLTANLICYNLNWTLYLSLKNQKNITCVEGISYNFPLDRATLTGTTKMDFLKIGNNQYKNDQLIIGFKPIE